MGTKINPSNTSGPSSPLRSKSITPSGSATTNITTNSTWTSWPPTLSEECTSVLRSSGNTLAFERSPDWQIDYEVYDWVKVDWDSAEAKELVTLYWKAEDGMKYDGKVLSECKIYK